MTVFSHHSLLSLLLKLLECHLKSLCHCLNHLLSLRSERVNIHSFSLWSDWLTSCSLHWKTWQKLRRFLRLMKANIFLFFGSNVQNDTLEILTVAKCAWSNERVICTGVETWRCVPIREVPISEVVCTDFNGVGTSLLEVSSFQRVEVSLCNPPLYCDQRVWCLWQRWKA